MSKQLPEEYKKMIELRNKMVEYCTTSERRLDVGVGLDQSFIKDKVVSDKDKANGIDYKLHAYASAEFIIEKSKEIQIINLVEAYKEKTDDQLKELGFSTQYGKYDAGMGENMECFIFAIEAQPDDYQRIRFPLSKSEENAMDAREKERHPDIDINKRLYEEDVKEYDETKEKEAIISKKRL